jgi:hypothetical protein
MHSENVFSAPQQELGHRHLEAIREGLELLVDCIRELNLGLRHDDDYMEMATVHR